jgi:hypothetical protein
LGLPLAKAVLAKGFLINGSTTSAEKIAVLNKNVVGKFNLKVH